jgi:hypothetical protein
MHIPARGVIVGMTQARSNQLDGQLAGSGRIELEVGYFVSPWGGPQDRTVSRQVCHFGHPSFGLRQHPAPARSSVHARRLNIENNHAH